MKVTRDTVLENRRKILDAAARLFRQRGFDNVTVAEVMNAAGLTHGAFYGHFASKDALIAATLAHTLQEKADVVPAKPAAARAFAAYYLRRDHRDDAGSGCAIAALGSELVRAPRAARRAVTDATRQRVEVLGRTAPGRTRAAKRRAAIGAWSAMVGALTLARMVDDAELSDEILAETAAWLDERR